MTQNQRFFKVTITNRWVESTLDYEHGKSHADVAAKLQNPNKRIKNERFREIEKTGNYFRVTECIKGGKSFIFEIC